MFIPSNDWFYTSTDADNSLDLFVGGEPVSGEVAATDIAIWDAGTEVDEEPGTGSNQVQRQEAPNTGDADPDTRVASLAGRGQSVSLNGRVLRMVITPQNVRCESIVPGFFVRCGMILQFSTPQQKNGRSLLS